MSVSIVKDISRALWNFKSDNTGNVVKYYDEMAVQAIKAIEKFRYDNGDRVTIEALEEALK